MEKRSQTALRGRRAALVLLSMFCAATAPTAGCRGTRPKPQAAAPPVFVDEADWGNDLFVGKSVREIRRFLRGVIDTPVTASFRSASLRAVVRELSRKTGLGIGITQDVLRDMRARPIDLDVRNMPARYVFDWLTRLLHAHYALEGPSVLFLLRDPTWPSQDRLVLRSYAIGALYHIGRPRVGRYDRARDSNELLRALRYCLKQTMTGHEDAKLVLDDTGSRLTAILPPRGHAKLARILQELKRPRKYEPPLDLDKTPDLTAPLRTPVTADFARQDVRRIADELGRRANVNIGFDYRLIPPRRREVALALGRTTLGDALRALAREAGLGRILAEPGRRFWILARDQDPSLLETTGELPWDRVVVRSYYIKPQVDLFGVQLVMNTIRRAVTLSPRAGRLPLGVYHAPSGRLLVLHHPEGQRAVARCIQKMVEMTRPEKTRRRP